MNLKLNCSTDEVRVDYWREKNEVNSPHTLLYYCRTPNGTIVVSIVKDTDCIIFKFSFFSRMILSLIKV